MKFFLYFIILILIGIISIYVTSFSSYPTCFNLLSNDQYLRVKLNSKNENENVKFNIFFVETNQNKRNLNFKELCVIESTALNNPNALIYYYSVNSVIDNYLLKRYKNIQTKKLIIEDVFKNTPFSSLWNKILMEKKQMSLNHLSDSLRLAFVWKYGGIYLDTDVITIKNLGFLLNFPGIGAWSKSESNGAVLVFPKNHPYINESMKEFVKSYDPNCYACLGPVLLSRVFNTFCNTTDHYKTHLLTKEIIYDKMTSGVQFDDTGSNSKCKIFIYPIDYFYSIAWTQHNLLFDKNSKINKEIFIDSYGIHFWNYVSKNNHVKYGDGSIFDYFAKLNCPSLNKINNTWEF